MNNPLNVRIIPFACLIFFGLCAGAQDIHFSQIHSVPQLINPATAGLIEAKLRVANNYRNQWRQLNFPYVSNYLSVDTKLKGLGRPLGFGFLFLHDESTNRYLSADKFYLALNHSMYFNNQQLTVGLQPGLVLKSLNNRAITFGSQFDPDAENFDPDLPSGEDFLEDRMNYIDINAGVLWQSRIKQIHYMAGFSVSHLNKPVESFYNRNDSSRLAMKFNLHGSVRLPLHENYEVMPLFLYSSTAGSNEFVGGAVASYFPLIDNLAIKRLYVLSQFRANPFKTVDAVIIGAGMNFANLDICISYDITTSNLRKASKVQRAFEISLIYQVFQHKTESQAEPCYML